MCQMHIWKSEDNFQGSFLTFHHVGSREFNSGRQASCQVPLPSELSIPHPPRVLCLLLFYCAVSFKTLWSYNLYKIHSLKVCTFFSLFAGLPFFISSSRQPTLYVFSIEISFLAWLGSEHL